ncbi:(2Fe-2S)-binding protein [Kitasatospora sp. NPDC002227]|uniref:(2Fe-2S)-binding protein n=1 Tax=Kitasatospora sp. NPDC002227 TaxID=3154773 RepID=UPI00333248F1
MGPYFSLGQGTPPAGFAPLLDLYRPEGALAERVAAAARQLRTAETRVAASVLHLGLAARLCSVVLATATLGRALPALGPDVLLHRWPADGPLELWLPAPSAATAEPLAAAVHRTLVTEHLTPLHAALHGITPVAPRLLWGNAASALAGSLQILHTRIAPADPASAALALELTQGLLAAPPLLGTGTLAPDEFSPPTAPQRLRRSTCCLFYRLPAGGTCGDCVFGTAPPRLRTSRAGTGPGAPGLS